MKKITRIEDVYCVPKTEEDLNYFGCSKGVHIKWSEPSFKGHSGLSYHYKEVLGVDMGSRTEIPVDRFLDLLNDKIADWRLEEVGFVCLGNGLKVDSYLEIGNSKSDQYTWRLEYSETFDLTFLNRNKLNITTFTELLRQMKFLGWKNYEQ